LWIGLSAVLVNAFPVDQGHFAQHNTAPSCDDAAFVGETDHHLKPAESMLPRSNPSELLASLKEFFKNNPSWS
jgi:hypothetical protein